MSARNAVEQLKSFGNKFRGILEVIEFLEGLANIEQAESEAIARKNKANNEAKEAEAATESVKSELQSKRGELNAVELQIQQQKQVAQEEKDRLLSAAKEEAAGIVKEADNRKEAIDSDVATARTVLSGLEEKIRIQQNESEKLNSTIQETKARIGAL